MTHTGFIEVKRIGQAVWSPSEPVMNDVMDTVKMPEVTVIANVTFMVFTVVTRVTRVPSRVRGMSTRMSTMSTTMAATLAICNPAPSDKNHHYGYQK